MLIVSTSFKLCSMQQNQTKPKMDDVKKAKLFYSGELLLIALVFLVLGILMLADVYHSSDTRRTIFIWVTLFGGFLMIGDFFWTLLSKKHRKKASLLDKILVLPAGCTFISYDLYVLISSTTNADLHRFLVGSVFCYIAAIYIFESLFHYRHPIPGLFDDEENKPEETVNASSAPAASSETSPDEKPADEEKKS